MLILASVSAEAFTNMTACGAVTVRARLETILSREENRMKT